MSITSANAVFMLSISSLYASPQQLMNFATDDIYDADVIQVAEAMMGVDGHLTAGHVFEPVQMKIAFMADSPSLPIFENWETNQRKVGDVYPASGTITLVGVNRQYTLNNGFLVSYPVLPNAKKVLQPRIVGITWESITASRLGSGT